MAVNASVAGRLADFAAVVIAVAAVSLVGIRIYDRFHVVRPIVGRPSFEPRWREFATGTHRLGARSPAVTITEFADFECPFCRVVAADLDSVLARYPSVGLIYRHALGPKHRFATQAALASICAESQGRFGPFLHVAYSNQDSIGLKPWAALAAEANVPDTALFMQCLRDPAPRRTLAADTMAAKELGVVGTPTLLIDSIRILGSPGLGQLDSLVRRALRGPAGRP